MTHHYPLFFHAKIVRKNVENTQEIHVSPTSRVDIFEMHDPIGIIFIGDLDIALY